MAVGSPQLTIDALNTATPNLAHLMPDLYIYADNAHIPKEDGLLLKSSIDVLNTATPNLAHLMAELYI